MHRSLRPTLLFALTIILMTVCFGWTQETTPPASTPAPAVEQPAPAEGTTPAPAEGTAPAPTEGTTPAPTEGTTPTSTPAPAEPANIITKIQVTGNTTVPAKDITDVITSKVGQVYTKAQVDQDRAAILNLGWFARVEVVQETTESGIVLTFRVIENPVVTDIQFEGNTVFTRQQLLAVMKTKPGQIFNRQYLSQDSVAIVNLYRSNGYILALVLGSNMSDTTGVLTIGIAEGVIEAIRITGNTRTKDKVIRRYIRTKPGDVYNNDRVGADINRLVATRYFDSVQRSAEVGSEPGRVILIITVVERKRTGQATVGGGYSSVQGLVGFIDLTKENLRGTGQAVTVRTEFGGRASYEFYYRHPWVMSPETRLNLGLYNRLIVREAFVNTDTGDRQSVQYDERRSGGSFTLGRPLSDRTIVYLGARSDRASITGLTEEEKLLLTGPAFEPRDVRSLTTALAHDSRDVREYPRRGMFYQLSGEFAGVLGGSADFNKYSADARRYFPIGQKKTFAMRLLLGTITGDAPYLEQFLIGGTESLRGFRTDRFVGTHLALLNSELRIPIGEKLIGVLFVDVGDAWGGNIAADPIISGDTSFTAHVGYGVGVRVATPIGPLRLDLGFSEDGTETHFGISQMF